MNRPSHTTSDSTQPEPLDLRERGAAINGEPQTSNARLYVQLQVFTGALSTDPIVEVLKESQVESVFYLDTQDPYGFGIATFAEDPAWFVKEGRQVFHHEVFHGLVHKPDFTMFGRTYATGHEPNLNEVLLERPRRYAFNTDWPWVVWYPLRRKPEFALLEPREQGKIMFEHAQIGMRYGSAGYAGDIRLTSYGIDTSDNEFVLGLAGPELYPLSRLVQDMRKTQQTARYIESLGPFFVGHAVWRSKSGSASNGIK